MPQRIDYYMSLVSPWSYLGHADFLRVVTKHGLDISYKPLPVGRLFAETGGTPVAQRHPNRLAHRLMDLQRWRAKRQLPMNIKPKFWPFDASLADRLIIALAASGAPVESVLPQAFASVFEAERDLADEAVLARLLSDAGLDEAALLARAKSDETKASYEANLAEAVARGIFGCPSYVRDGEVFWGQDRIDFLEEAIESGRPAFSAATV